MISVVGRVIDFGGDRWVVGFFWSWGLYLDCSEWGKSEKVELVLVDESWGEVDVVFEVMSCCYWSCCKGWEWGGWVCFREMGDDFNCEGGCVGDCGGYKLGFYFF